MESKRKVGILNAYDARNRGDRAIVKAQLGWIERTLPGAEVTVFSPHHKFNKRIFSSETSRAPLFGTPRDRNPVEQLLRPALDWVLHEFGWRNGTSAEAFHQCHAYFVCGGGYLYSSPSKLPSRQLLLHAANIRAALKTGKPVLSFPQSWGPIRKKQDSWICKHLANLLPVLVTRGQESDKLLASWGVAGKIVSLPDVVIAAAALLPRVKEWRKSPRRHGSLGIAPVNWNFERPVSAGEIEAYLDKLVKISMTWCATPGRTVTIFPQVEVEGRDDDRLIARQLAVKLERAGLPGRVEEQLEWDAYWREIAAQDVFVGCRMHSCIFAMVCGVPTVGLGYQPKFAELFEQLGWPDRSHLIDQFTADGVSSQLKHLAEHCNRENLQASVDAAGKDLVKALDETWRTTVEGCKNWASATRLVPLVC